LDGVAVVINNVQGNFWGLVCYRKGGQANQAYCHDAIATAARSGGLAFVGAKPIAGLGDGRLETPAGCQEVPGRKIHCADAELSWTAAGEGGAEARRQETLQGLQTMAAQEKMKIRTETRACSLFSQVADCLLVFVEDPKSDAQLNFILLLGGGQERLVVCSASTALDGALPVPCDQAISLAEQK